jgi:hypothetical protein
MILFIQCIIVGFAFFILLNCIREGKLTTGLIEWIVIIAAFIILIKWIAKY